MGTINNKPVSEQTSNGSTLPTTTENSADLSVTADKVTAAIVASANAEKSTPASLDSLNLSDEYIPPSVTGAHPVKPKPGYVVTPVMASPIAMSHYATAAGVVYLQFSDAQNYIENTSILSRGADGLARYADCVIAVETQKHYDARMTHKNARHQADEDNTAQSARNDIMAGIKNDYGFPINMSPNATVK